MNLLYITVIAVTIIHVKAGTVVFESKIEAFVKGGKNLCLGDCGGWKGNEKCVKNWQEDVAPCSVLTGPDNITPKYTRRFKTIVNQVCYSNCGKYNETYDWCVTKDLNGIHSWNHCSRTIALKGVQTFRTANELLTCTDDCIKRTENFYWCHTIKEWQRCDPQKKVILFNFLTENDKECATPCELQNNLPYCYNTDGDWKKCYLNPDSTDELSRISQQTKSTRHPGIYTAQGYRRCKRNYRKDAFVRPLSVEDIAKQYEENFPTITRRDPNNIASNVGAETNIDERHTDDSRGATDPVLSYTVYNTLSHFSKNQLNLPLVIRAVITNQTLRRDDNDVLMNQFFDLYPIDDRVNYDEMGHFVPIKLGGKTEPYNIFPQSWRHNKGAISGWWYLESDLFTFINTHPNSYAEYTVVVTYKPDDERPYRPTAVGVRVRLYYGTLQGDGTSQLCDVNGVPTTPSMNSLENMYFVNDPDFNCILDDHDVEETFA